MKTTQRIPKAIAVIIVVGVGLLHNMNEKTVVMETFREITSEINQNQIKSDSIQTNDSKLFIYTKAIINTSIQHLISSI